MLLYHSCTISGLDNLAVNYNEDEEICFSSSESHSLFGRHIVIEVEVDEKYISSICHQDKDAQKNFGYDEIRASIPEDEFWNGITRIIFEDSFKKFVEDMEDDEKFEEARNWLLSVSPEWQDTDFEEELAEMVYGILEYREIGEHWIPVREYASTTDLDKEFLNFD